MTVRIDMPFFQVKKVNNGMITIGLFFLISVLSGCIAQNPQTPVTEDTAKPIESSEQASSSGSLPRQIDMVRLNPSDQGVEVLIQGSEKLSSYTSIKQPFPFGIGVYLPETRISENLVVMAPKHDSISDIVVSYADKEETTAKIEILLTRDLKYEVLEDTETLTVVLQEFQAPPMPKMAHHTDHSAQKTTALNMSGASEAPSAAVIPDATATMTDIEFNTLEDGRSDIAVHTSHPVNYDITQEEDGKIYLNLHNTKVPYYHNRVLLTHYFKSAVESLLPEQVPGRQTEARIQINTRDTVPYRVVQDQNVISLSFEPSTITPPVFTKAQKTVSAETSAQLVAAPPQNQQLSNDSQGIASEKLSAEERMFGPEKRYTGEKIKLDFYETDIKNVIRILRSVGGLNFAIDKDVEGKVTLTLEDPVPWDQVLDLVLKMNNLGQKREGNVIRIATLNTLKEEENQLQEAIAAKKASMEQKESFEPLVTEYIPINYSDAEVDIKPHLDQVLTKDRGKLSVDKRTNMIIITDIQSKIDQAKEIIYRLDKVTPQIMIEAKVVEVTKDFSRSLGLGLSLTKTQTASTGRERDFSIALNSPLTSPGNTGAFNFYRILGSNFLNLNAQIAASEQKGDVKVVSSPRILTLDNKKAKIKQGLEYAYLERDSSGGSSVKFKDIDLLLEVTPHVTPDKRISMTVFLTKNDIDSVTNGVPSLSTNEAETELLVNDKDTIIIGGIVKTTDNKGSVGTPLLSGIPILGRLFRTDTTEDERKELLIFLTPSIVQLEQKQNIFTATD